MGVSDKEYARSIEESTSFNYMVTSLKAICFRQFAAIRKREGEKTD